MCKRAQTRPQGNPRTILMSRTKYRLLSVRTAEQVAGVSKQTTGANQRGALTTIPGGTAVRRRLVQCPSGLPLGALVAAEALGEGRDGAVNNSQKPSDREEPDAAPDEQAWVGFRELGCEGRGGRCEMNPHLESQAASRRDA